MIKIVDFETILPIWRDNLWKGRISKIEESNGIDYLGKYNPDILKNKATCFAYFEGSDIIGVNSLLPTSDTYCRSRGFYINPEQRLKGLGKKLMEKTLQHAVDLKFKYIWSLPRKSALPFYLKFGFKQTSNFNNQYEFGPNCFIIKKIGE